MGSWEDDGMEERQEKEERRRGDEKMVGWMGERKRKMKRCWGWGKVEERQEKKKR